MSVNGSSATGHCLSYDSNGDISTCSQPASSVLFDGATPALISLDGNMWASQLLTLQGSTRVQLTFDVTDVPGYMIGEDGRVEVVLFNCPQWGVSVVLIDIFGALSVQDLEGKSFAGRVSPTITSCYSLVSVCIPIPTYPVLVLGFELHSASEWVHLGEVTLYGPGNCQPDAIIIPPPIMDVTYACKLSHIHNQAQWQL